MRALTQREEKKLTVTRPDGRPEQNKKKIKIEENSNDPHEPKLQIFLSIVFFLLVIVENSF